MRSGGGGNTIRPELSRAGRTVTYWEGKGKTLREGIRIHKILNLGHYRKYLLILVRTDDLGKKQRKSNNLVHTIKE